MKSGDEEQPPPCARANGYPRGPTPPVMHGCRRFTLAANTSTGGARFWDFPGRVPEGSVESLAPCRSQPSHANHCRLSVSDPIASRPPPARCRPRRKRPCRRPRRLPPRRGGSPARTRPGQGPGPGRVRSGRRKRRGWRGPAQESGFVVSWWFGWSAASGTEASGSPSLARRAPTVPGSLRRRFPHSGGRSVDRRRPAGAAHSDAFRPFIRGFARAARGTG